MDANAPAPSMHAPRIDDRTGPRRSQFSSIPILAVAARLSPSLLSTRVLLSHRRSSPRSLAMDPARRRSTRHGSSTSGLDVEGVGAGLHGDGKGSRRRGGL